MRVFYLTCLLFLPLTLLSQDITLDIKVNGLELCGALRLPEMVGDTCFTNSDTCYVCDSLPVVVIIHDEGPWNFNGEIIVAGGFQNCLNPDLVGNHLKLYKDMADAFEARGIASFRYCKRNFLYGNDVLDPETSSPYDYVSDASQIILQIRQYLEIEEIDHKIYLLGHGQGAHLLPEITDSTSSDEISGFISLNGAAVGVDTTRSEFIRHVYRRCLQDSINGDVAYDTVLTTYGKIRDKLFPYDQEVRTTLPGNNPLDLGHPYFSEAWMTITDTFLQKFDHFNKPSLFINGSKDQFIFPWQLDLFSERTNLSDGTFILAEGVKHLLVEEGQDKVSDKITTPICDWIWSQCDTLIDGISSDDTELNFFHVGYPNPVSDIFTVSGFSKQANNLHLQVFDMNGKEVLTRGNLQAQKSGEIHLDLSPLSTGHYLLLLTHEKNGFYKNYKIEKI